MAKRGNLAGRKHAGGGIAGLSLLLVAGAAFKIWRTSRQGQPSLDARTRARLQPRHGSTDGTEAR